ncbi:MAG: phage terminase small subunit P27 family [Elusimicrobiales bacterium]
MRGRKPIPTEIKRKTGTLKRCRTNPAEPRPGPASSAPPEFLDDEAKAKWRELFPELSALGVVSSIDRDLFMLYCSAYSNWKRANDALKKTKPVYRTPNGAVQQSPFVSIARGWMLMMTKLAAEMGIPATMRSRIIPRPDKDGGDEDERFFDKPS